MKKYSFASVLVSMLFIFFFHICFGAEANNFQEKSIVWENYITHGCTSNNQLKNILKSKLFSDQEKSEALLLHTEYLIEKSTPLEIPEEELLKLGKAATIPILMRLRHNDDRVRQYALSLLPRINDEKECIDAFASALFDKNNNVRSVAIISIGHYKEKAKSQLPYLLQIMFSDHSRFSPWAAKSISKIMGIKTALDENGLPNAKTVEETKLWAIKNGYWTEKQILQARDKGTDN